MNINIFHSIIVVSTIIGHFLLLPLALSSRPICFTISSEMNNYYVLSFSFLISCKIFLKIWLEKEEICYTHLKHGGQNTNLQSMDYP